MGIISWVVGIILLSFSVLFVYSLCVAAKTGDRMIGADKKEVEEYGRILQRPKQD